MAFHVSHHALECYFKLKTCVPGFLGYSWAEIRENVFLCFIQIACVAPQYPTLASPCIIDALVPFHLQKSFQCLQVLSMGPF